MDIRTSSEIDEEKIALNFMWGDSVISTEADIANTHNCLKLD
jgi:hypothetical protein